jgi:hypothetical protein
MKAETAPILDFISHLVSSLAWPSTVLTTIFLLRRHIQTLVPLVRTVKYSDVEIRFGQELAELKRATDISELPNAKHSAKAVSHWFFRVPVVLSAIRTFQDEGSVLPVIRPRRDLRALIVSRGALDFRVDHCSDKQR